MTSAQSSGVPILPSGVSSASACIVSASCIRFLSVLITPGETQLTRIPEGPTSFASAFVKPMIPAFAAE